MRTDVNFNRGWEFILSDTEPSADADWRPVTLPHDWDVEYELTENAASGGGGGYARAGIGWYRRHFALSMQETAGRHVSLLFEGVYMNASVYLNGELLAHHNYGYTPFVVSLDQALKCCSDPDANAGSTMLHNGEKDAAQNSEAGNAILPAGEESAAENTLLVRVDNSLQPGSRWYSGSGIYRDVHLLLYPDVHIAPWGIRCAANAIYPDTDSADLLIQTTVCNESSDRLIIGVLHELFDRKGAKIASSGAGLLLEAAGEGTCRVRPMVSHPHLWDVEDPYLYTLVTQVQIDGETVDTVSTPVGIRTATFDCDRGFLLNGTSVKIKGMCLHHDCGLTGAASYRDVWERRLFKLKDMGCNAIRCSHNPPDPVLLDLCDGLGFLVMDEIFDEWMLTKNKNHNYYSQSFAYGSGLFFGTDAKRELTTMLRRDFNHPSVILWSIGNEIPEQSSLDGVKLLQFLQDICHEEDSTRMVTCACDNIASGSSARTLRAFENSLDVVGYNYVGRWRNRAETFYDEDRELFPMRRFCGSENPSVGGERGVYPEASFWGSYAAATLNHEALWRYIVSHDFVAGDFLWTGIDYLGETHWPKKGAACGPIDTAGFEKDAFYYFRSLWNRKETTLHLMPHWNWPGQEGEFKQVVCYTNCEEVALYLNGRLVGRKGYVCPRHGAERNWYERNGRYATTNDLHLSWDVPYEPGELKAVGFKDGQEVAFCSVVTTGAATALKAQAFKAQVPVNGILQIEVEATDTENRFVPFADNPVRCEIEGPAHLLGMDNGDLSDLTLCGLPERRLFSGKLLAAFVADGPGTVTITFTSEGLKTAQIKLQIM